MRVASTLVTGLVLALLASGCGDGEPPEHAVIVHLNTSEARSELDVYEVEDALIEAIEAASAGEFDGNEVALDGSEVVLYAYGPDADALYAAMERVLRRIPPPPGSYAIKRYGEAGDRDAKQVRVDL